MATLTIEGRKVKVDDAFLSLSPEEQADTVDEIAASIGITAPAPESDQSQAVRQDLAATADKFFQGKNDGALRNADSFMRGAADTASFGLADEAAALGDRYNPFKAENYSSPTRALETLGHLNPITGVVDQAKQLVAPDEDMESALRRERAFQSHREDIDPAAMTTGRVSGALLGAGALIKAKAPLMTALPADASLAAKTAQSAKAGALYSGLYGFGSGEGLTDRVEEGATQAALGTAIGGVLPAAVSTISALTKPVRDAVTGFARPETFASKKVVERLAKDQKTPEQAAKLMAREPGMNLADVAGDSTKGLLRTAYNVPGKAQTKIRARLNIRQMQQGDRIKKAVRQTLADPDGYLFAKDEIENEAKTLAASLMDEARSIAIPFTETLESALVTPAGRKALSIAHNIAENEQQPFRQMFIDINGNGRRVPDVRAWEYIRQAMDDMIEAEIDPITKRMTAAGRAIYGLQKRVFDEVRAANTPYDESLKIWSGSHKLDNALEAGREILKQSPEATRRQMSTMSEADKRMFRMGVASAIRDKVSGTSVMHNALFKFFSTSDNLANLKAGFDDPEQFKAFRQVMIAEARKRSTYNALGNSTTTKQALDAKEAGGLDETVGLLTDVAQSGFIRGALKYVGSHMKMIGGFTPEVADRVSQKLLTTDPAMVRKITTELAKIRSQQISADQKRQLTYRVIAPLLATEARTANAQ
jgi:hypothetical protein